LLLCALSGALGLGHGVHGRLQRIEAGVDGLERLFDLLRDDGLIHPAVHRCSAERDGGDRAAGDERGAANARRTHHLHRDGAQARLAQLPGRIGRECGELFSAVHGLAQERELLLQGLDLLFASHIRSPPFLCAPQSATGAPLSAASTSVSPS